MRQKRALSAALVLSIALPSAAQAAGPFQVKDRQSDADGTPFQAIYDEMNSVADELEDEVNNGFMSEASRLNFLEPVAKSHAIANKGLGADYGSNPTRMVVGAGAAGGFNFGGGSTSFSSAFATGGTNSLPSVGVGVHASVLLGMNAGFLGMKKLGPIEGRRLNLYVNGFSYNAKSGELSFGMSSFGLHGQYKLVEPKRAGFAAGWGGIDFTTGIEYSSLSVGFKTPFDIEASTGDTTIAWDADVNLGVKSSTFTVPIELSTNVDLFHTLGAFFGTGVDLNFSGAHFTGGASGPITATYNGDTTGFTGTLFEGTGDLDLEGDELEAGAGALVPRIFGGLQFNIWALKMMAQGNYSTDGSKGVSLGMRVAF